MENPCGHIALQMVACSRIGIKSLKILDSRMKIVIYSFIVASIAAYEVIRIELSHDSL